MNLLKDVGRELLGMFLGDARLAAAVLALVGGVAALARTGAAPPIALGAALLIGALAILVAVAATEARRRRRGDD